MRAARAAGRQECHAGSPPGQASRKVLADDRRLLSDYRARPANLLDPDLAPGIAEEGAPKGNSRRPVDERATLAMTPELSEVSLAVGQCRRASLARRGIMISGPYRTTVTTIALVALLLAVFVSKGASQPPTVPQPPLVIEGRVLWVDFGSQAMVVAPDNAPAITVDLRRIRQSDYHGFRGNEYVRIVGFILRPNPRIQAFELDLVTPWYPRAPQSP